MSGNGEAEFFSDVQKEQLRTLEDAGPDPQLQSLIAREEGRQQIPEFDPPTGTEVLGEICETCHGTTWVIRANPELEGPVMAQLMHCDNPDCPQTAAMGDRKIIHLALPYNHFTQVISLPGGKIVALMES